MRAMQYPGAVPGPGRPALPLPPERMPLLRGGRPLKRWSWVGAFGPELMLCAARARDRRRPDRVVGGVGPRGGRLDRAHRARRGGVDVVAAPRPRRGRARGARARARGRRAAVEVVSPHGAQYIWTRKRGGVAARGRSARRARRALDARAIVDETAGYHARHTAWRWSAGVGVAVSRARRSAWNLVDGIHDAPAGVRAHGRGSTGRPRCRRSPGRSSSLPRSATS